MAHKGWREIFYHGNQLSHIQCHFYQILNFFRKKKLEYVKQQKFLSCVICTKDWKRKFCRKNFYNITFKIACSANNNNFHFQEMCHQQGSVEISLELYPELIRWEWGPLQPKGNFAKVLSTPIQNINISRRNSNIHFCVDSIFEITQFSTRLVLLWPLLWFILLMAEVWGQRIHSFRCKVGL